MRQLVTELFEGSLSDEIAKKALDKFIDKAPRSVPARAERAKALVQEWLNGRYDTELEMYIELLSVLDCVNTTDTMTSREFVEAAARLIIQGTPLLRVRGVLRAHVLLLTISEFPDPEDIIWMRDAIRSIRTDIDRTEFFDQVMGVLR